MKDAPETETWVYYAPPIISTQPHIMFDYKTGVVKFISINEGITKGSTGY